MGQGKPGEILEWKNKLIFETTLPLTCSIHMWLTKKIFFVSVLIMKIGNKKITRINGTIKTSPCHSKKKSWRVNKSSITNSWRVFFLSDPGLPRSVVWLMMWCIKTLLMWRTWCKQTAHCELLPPAVRRWKKLLWASYLHRDEKKYIFIVSIFLPALWRLL